MGSFHLHVMCTRIGAMNFHRKRALTPSPSPIGWERVAAGRVRVRFMGRLDLRISDAHWDHELLPLPSTGRGPG